MIQDTILKKWQRFCDSQGFQKAAAAARLGIHIHDYDAMLKGNLKWDELTLDKMERIIEGREILNQSVLPTDLYKQLEKYVNMCLADKLMVTLAAPTGQGKTISAKHLAHKFGLKYFPVLSDMQKPKVAARKKLIMELLKSFNVQRRNTYLNLSTLVSELQSDTRHVLIVDESQRLITEDWGYFKVIQDLMDNVQNFSVIMLGNYAFYGNMFVNSSTTYQGIADQEQFLRRISIVQKLPRMTKNDVKLWCNYNNIVLKPTEHQSLADYFSYRAGLADLENVRKELIRIMGRGKIRSWKDVTSGVMIAIYKKLHTEIEFTEGEDAEKSENAAAEAA